LRELLDGRFCAGSGCAPRLASRPFYLPINLLSGLPIYLLSGLLISFVSHLVIDGLLISFVSHLLIGLVSRLLIRLRRQARGCRPSRRLFPAAWRAAPFRVAPLRRRQAYSERPRRFADARRHPRVHRPYP